MNDVLLNHIKKLERQINQEIYLLAFAAIALIIAIVLNILMM